MSKYRFIVSGFNDNPTAQQFEAAYRKLLIHNDVMCSNKSNCIDHGTKILTVSSNRQKMKKCDDGIDYNGDADLDDFFFDPEYADSFFLADYVDDPHSHSLAYMASALEAKIMSTKSLKQPIRCEDCISVLIENELIEDSFIRFKARRTNMLQPCKSTFDICKFVDSFVDTCTGATSYKHVTMQILRNIPFESLYTSSSFSGHPGEKGHKYMFVKKIVEMYMDMKSAHVAKCFTLKTHDEPIRHQYKKLIQQRGQ